MKYWIIDGFEIKDAYRSGIDARNTDHITVQNCYVHDNGTNGRATGIFFAFSNYPTVRNSESAYNSEHGIYQSNSGDYGAFLGNRLHHNDMSGLHLNGDASMGGDGVVSYSRIENNMFFENGSRGGSAINMDGASDSVIINNLIYNNHASGISLFKIDGAEASSRNVIYQNTIVMPADGRWAINMPGDGSPRDNVLRNNVLFHAHASRGAISIDKNRAPGFNSDYNVVISRFSLTDQSSTVDLNDWRAAGFDDHSRISSPSASFVSASAADFHPSSTSPLRNAGQAHSMANTDLDGRARDSQNTPDVGCYEGSDASPPPPSVCIRAATNTPFVSTTIARQTQSFELQLDLTPSSRSMDAAVALAGRQASSWTHLAAIVRFNSASNIDVRDGSRYRADRTVAYVAGATYRVRLVVDVAAHRYDVFVKPPNASEVQLADDFAFRSEQAGVTALDRIVGQSENGSLEACKL